MNVPTWGWYLTIGLMPWSSSSTSSSSRAAPTSLDGRGERHLAFYVSAADPLRLFVWWEWGGQYAGEFYAGWLTEYSLSVDNLFVFLLIMSSFKVPQRLQQSALMVGIIIAIVLLASSSPSARSSSTRMPGSSTSSGPSSSTRRSSWPGVARPTTTSTTRTASCCGWKTFPATEGVARARLTIVRNGKRLITPMMIVILALGTTDLLFALDSIPAIYGLTKEPFLVLTANIFALMGLRQLYFLIGGLLKRLVYLSIGLAVLLGFIGVKLIMHALHENNLPFLNGGEPYGVPDIPITVSLGAIVLILGVTTVASLLKTRRDAAARPPPAAPPTA